MTSKIIYFVILLMLSFLVTQFLHYKFRSRLRFYFWSAIISSIIFTIIATNLLLFHAYVMYWIDSYGLMFHYRIASFLFDLLSYVPPWLEAHVDISSMLAISYIFAFILIVNVIAKIPLYYFLGKHLSDEKRAALGITTPRISPNTREGPESTRIENKALFRHEDYWPYIFGIFIFAGIIAVPTIWSMFVDLPYRRILAGSLLGSMIFAYAHTREGEFQINRFLLGFAGALLLSLQMNLKDGAEVFIPGGILGFVIMAAGGWLGIGLGRITGISRRLDQ